MRGTFLKLHLSVFIAGFTGVLGKLISLNEGLLVWYRLLFTTIIFFLFLYLTKKLQRISFRDFKRIAPVGAFLALHWVFFYGSIKSSNVSVGVVCFSLVGLFSAIFEPLILHRKFSFCELIYSLITLLGVVLIFSLDVHYRTGIILGIISSALAALFTITTKRIGKDYPPRTILLYEMLAGFLVISAILPFYLKFFPVETLIPCLNDILFLLILCVVCTVGLQLLQIIVLKKISAFTVSLTYNLEPIYSIVIAIFFLGEAKELSPAFYAGVGLIILSVFLQMVNTLKEKNTGPTIPQQIA